MSHRKALTHLKKSDPKLKALIEKVGPPTLKPESGVSPYEALVESIVYQQLHGKAAKAIFSRVLALYSSDRLPDPEVLLATSDEKLRACGLSASKLKAIQGIAQATSEGRIPSEGQALQLTDAELLEKLTALKGIGPWTVQMYLIFTLGRPDVMPSGDYGVKLGFQLLYRKRKFPTPRQLEEHAEIWRPYRSVASWYLWRATEVLKKPKPKHPITKKITRKAKK